MSIAQRIAPVFIVASLAAALGCDGGQANTRPPRPPPAPKDASGARVIAYRYLQNGEKRLDAGDIDLAIQSHERAVTTLERAARELPHDAFADDLAKALNRLARAQFCASRVSDAIATYERSRQLQESSKGAWADGDTEANLMWTEYYLSDTLRHSGDFDRAAEIGQQALARGKTLIDRPNSAGVNTTSVATLEEKIEETDLAKSASNQWPPPPALTDENRFLFCYYRVNYFASRGELAVAEEALEYWKSLSPPGQEKYNLACGHGIVAKALVAQGATKSDEGRAKFDAQAAAALAALREAIAAGYSHFEHMRSDLDLIALRKMPEFRALVQMK